MGMCCVGTGASIRKPNRGIRARFRFDGEGTVLRDDAGASGTWTPSGSFTQSNAGKFIGGCYTGGGLNSYAESDTRWADFLHQLGGGGKGFTVTFWYKMTAGWSASMTLFDTNHLGSDAEGISIYISGIGRLTTRITNGAAYVINNYPGALVQTPVQWRFVCLSFLHDPATNNLKCWVDGAAFGSVRTKAAASTSSTTSTNLPTIGGYLDYYGIPAEFSMDELTFYDVALDGLNWVPSHRAPYTLPAVRSA